MGSMVVTSEVLAAKFEVIFPHLDERQRRLLLGAEARALGHGGIRLVARAAGGREGTGALGGGGGGRPRRLGGGPGGGGPGSSGRSAAIRCRRCGGRPSRPGRWRAS